MGNFPGFWGTPFYTGGNLYSTGLRQAIDFISVEDLSATLFSWCVCKFRPMSGAQYGYLDPRSADKAAVDETEKIELQVLCLTGEGVTLTVSRSMLGYDLRRLVSKNLSCKAGAKLVVHSVNRKLTLDENLEDQGIVGKNAMLSCTYYQLMCIQHGVIPVSSQIVTESLH